MLSNLGTFPPETLGDDGTTEGKADDNNICWKFKPILLGDIGGNPGVDKPLGVFSGFGRPVMILVAGRMSEEGFEDSSLVAQEGIST